MKVDKCKKCKGWRHEDTKTGKMVCPKCEDTNVRKQLDKLRRRI